MTDLTSIDSGSAKLPSRYHAAKKAISQCATVDECKDWSDKAAALASYARQSKDDQLEKMAKRIRARATRRAGELLKQIQPQRGANQNITDGDDSKVLTRKQAARDAGMSERQQVTAQRVANVPAEDFERLVETDAATVTQLAALGTEATQKPVDHAAATALFNTVSKYRDAMQKIDIDAAMAALDERRRHELRMMIGKLDNLHDRIATTL